MDPKVITETPDYFVVNKPAGMAVEPPSHQKTLRDWLIENSQIKVGEWDEKSRYGVVHRLDTDTSGVMIWAKNNEAQEKLKLLWQGRQVEKTYQALVVGECQLNGTIELPIEHDNKKDKMRVAMLSSGRERPAITEYKTLKVGEVDGQKVSLVEAHPITGRTHQIRVHFKAIGHPLVGDKLYGQKSSDQIAKDLNLNRQFLHAAKICLPQEGSDQKICYETPLPLDLAQVLDRLNFMLS